jgi:hypothetical protein
MRLLADRLTRTRVEMPTTGQSVRL